MPKEKAETGSLTVSTKEKAGAVSAYYFSGDDGDFSLLKKESSQVEDSIYENQLYIEPPVSPDVACKLFEQNPFHLRAIRLKAVCVAGSGYDIKPDDPEKEDFADDTEYNKLKDFTKKPNEKMGIFDDIMTNLANDYFTYGYAYLEIVRNALGELGELYNLRAYNTFVKKKGQYPYYVQKGVNKDTEFKPYGMYKRNTELPEAVMIKSYNPKSIYYGFPDWYSAIGDLVLDRSIVEHAIRKFENNLMIQFVIIVEGGDLDADGMGAMQKFLRDNYKGVSNAGKVLTLKSDNPNVKINIEKISEAMQESGFTATREQSRDYILASHGIASILLGVKIKGQLGGTTEARDLFKIFNETVIKPDKRKFQETINRVIRDGLGIQNYHIEFRDLKIETFKDMGILVDLLVRSGLLEENEGRGMLDLSPKEETDKKEDAILNDENADPIEKAEVLIKKLVKIVNTR